MVVNLGVPIFVAPLASYPVLEVTKQGGESKAYALRNNGNITLNVVTLEGKTCPKSLQKVLTRLSPGQQSLLDTEIALCATAVQTDQGLIPLTYQ